MLIKKSNKIKTIEQIAKQVRSEIEEKYGDMLYGRCIEASDRIVELLKAQGIESTSLEGWIIYDDDSTCSDRSYDEHTWVEVDDIFLDVTLDQFQSFMYDEIPKIIIGDKPDFLVYQKPSHLDFE